MEGFQMNGSVFIEENCTGFACFEGIFVIEWTYTRTCLGRCSDFDPSNWNFIVD